MGISNDASIVCEYIDVCIYVHSGFATFPGRLGWRSTPCPVATTSIPGEVDGALYDVRHGHNTPFRQGLLRTPP